MATSVVTASIVAQDIFSTPTHKKGKIKGIVINNRSAAIRELTFADTFTNNDSTVRTTGVATTGASNTETVLIISVAAGVCVSLPENDLQALRIFGDLKCTADAIAATCDISTSYELID